MYIISDDFSLLPMMCVCAVSRFRASTRKKAESRSREKFWLYFNFFVCENEPHMFFVHVVLRILCVFNDKECGSYVMFWKAQKSVRGIRRVRLIYFFDHVV